MRRALVIAVVAAGCGGGGAPERPERPAARGPDSLTCADIRSRAQALRVARQVDHRVVAPDGQRRRETLDVIGGSLYATCRNPAMRRTKPVAPVLREVQAHFDAEALEGH